MDINWEDLKIFYHAINEKSMNKAALKLKLTQPTLSRRLSELEISIGESLINRHTNGITPTSSGEKLFQHARHIFEWSQDLDQLFTHSPKKPEGKVKISAPPGVAFDFLAPLSLDLKKKYPLIQLEINSKIQFVDLSRGEADLALRTSVNKNDDLEIISKARVSMGVFVSKKYFKNLPDKISLQDLDWISWAPPFDQLDMVMRLKKVIPNFKPVFTSDDYNVQLSALLSGAGAMILPKATHRHSKLQELVELNINLGPEAFGELYLVCHKKMKDLPKIRAVAELIKAEFQLHL